MIRSLGGARVLLAVTVAALATFTAALLAPRIPLYEPYKCPTFCHANDPRVLLVAAFAGIGYVVLVLGSARLPALAIGVAVGVGANLVAGAFTAVQVALDDAYFQTVYRLYGLVYLSVGSALAFIGAASVPTRTRALVLPILLAVVLNIVAAAFARHAVVAVASAVGLGMAAVVARARPRLPIRLSPDRIAIALVALAFVTRTAFGLQTLAQTGPGLAFAIASDDGNSYYALASTLAHDGGKLRDILSAGAYSPAYATFLGVLFALTNETMAVVVVVQALLAAAATYLVFRIAALIAGIATALLAAFLFAMDKNLIQNQSTLTAEALAVPLLLFSLYAYRRYRADEKLRWSVAAAVALTIAFIARNVLAIPMIVVVAIWLAAWRRPKVAALARDLGVLALTLMLISLPVAVATAQREGSPRITTQIAQLGWRWDGYDIAIGNTYLVERGIDPFADPLGSLARFVSDPLPVIRFEAMAVPQRMSALLFFQSPGSTDPLLIVNPLIYDNPLGDTIGLIRLIAAVLGVFVMVRTRWWRARPELGLLAGYTLAYLAVFAFIFPPFHPFRYRIPIEPLRFIAEAAGLILIARMLAYWVTDAVRGEAQASSERLRSSALTTVSQE